VLGPLRHLSSGIAYFARADRQQKSDSLTAEQHASPLPLPKGLEVTWFGTAGFRFAYQGKTLWIDPYLTRLPLRDFLRRRIVPPSDSSIARYVDKADAVLVGHTHFDHALDVPAIARHTGCTVYGSQSLHNLMGLYGLAPQATIVEPFRDYEVGPFRFHFVPSVHSKLRLGLGIPSDGELTCEHLDELTPQAYRCGQVWGIHIEVAGMRFYHQGSADFLEAELRDRNVDVFLCGIAGRRFTPDYVSRIVRALSPQMIVPTHYDDFFRPLDADKRFSFNVNLTGFADEVHTASHQLPLHVLDRGVPCRSSTG
jgi:L-ascorbate metabolism protein UlaG (beta-lactamase superfamily)